VGSGPGFASAMLAVETQGRPARWLLLDPQRGMWTVRPNGLARIAPGFRPDRAVADGLDLPLRGDCADVLISIGVLCCMTDSAVPGAVDEIRRVLKPGGWLLFRVPRRRGDVDVERFRRAGFREVARERPGSVLFQKPH
jgi:SAM-dependent methyltransferase